MEPARSIEGGLKTSLGGDPLRLNLFFNLLTAISRTGDFDELGAILGSQLRYVIDFDSCFLISGDPRATRREVTYSSSRSSPHATRIEAGAVPTPELAQALEECAEDARSRAPERTLCLDLITARGKLGALLLTRDTPFVHTEFRFAEAAAGYLAQMLDNFAVNGELHAINLTLKSGKMALRQLVAELEAERELRERFVSALTHDLRTPLTAARLLTQHLAHRTQEPGAVRAASVRIVTNIDRVDRMINNLLDITRIKAGERIPIFVEKCDLEEIIKSGAESLNRIYGPRFVVESGAADTVGYWDRGGVTRVLENLGTNAIKYGSAGESVTIRSSSGADWVEVAVHNHGVPISPEDQSLLFGQFSRTPSAIDSGQKGWGIGLALVQEIARAHEGSARVESTAQAGTTFFVRFARDMRQNESLDENQNTP